ncbi:MAG: hypothetical protein NVSMB39_6690 [Candidatus Saccharimonadales bacterium]
MAKEKAAHMSSRVRGGWGENGSREATISFGNVRKEWAKPEARSG